MLPGDTSVRLCIAPDTYAYSVSHDLKTPLRSIDGFTARLGEALQEHLSTSQEKLFQRSLSATSRMGVLMPDLLALAHMSQSEVHWKWVALGTLTKDVLATLNATKFSGRTFDFPVEPWSTAQCDLQLMRIAPNNLFDNAAKYTRDGSLAIIEFERATSEPGATATSTIQDNGAGFDMDRACLLFKHFQRLHGPDSAFDGTGIGLANVRRIVERHGGTIRARSDTEQGAVFRVTWGTRPLSSLQCCRRKSHPRASWRPKLTWPRSKPRLNKSIPNLPARAGQAKHILAKTLLAKNRA